jgi:hypothetical protein
MRNRKFYSLLILLFCCQAFAKPTMRNNLMLGMPSVADVSAAIPVRSFFNTNVKDLMKELSADLQPEIKLRLVKESMRKITS